MYDHVRIYRDRRHQLSVFEKLGVPGPKPELVFGNLREVREKVGRSSCFHDDIMTWIPCRYFKRAGNAELWSLLLAWTTDSRLVGEIGWDAFTLMCRHSKVLRRSQIESQRSGLTEIICSCRIIIGAHLLTWFNLNLIMDKQLHLS